MIFFKADYAFGTVNPKSICNIIEKKRVLNIWRNFHFKNWFLTPYYYLYGNKDL